MDFLLIHQVYTVVLLMLFIGLLGWTWHSSFHDASQMLFVEEPTQQEGASNGGDTDE